MAFLQWRRFNFFDREIVTDPSTSSAFDKLKEIDISSCACGRGQMVFGDLSGYLHFLSRHFELTVFKAYEIRVTHLHQLKQHNILVSVGEDEEGINPLIKVWNLDKVDRTGNPLCSRIVRAIPGARPTRVSCLTVHENLSLMAVGFVNGSIMLYKGDVTKERHSKQRLLYEGQQKITGLSFKPQMQNKQNCLYVATESEVLSISIGNKDKDQKNVLEFHGCPLDCSVLTDTTQDYQFVIGRQDAVYFYQTDERGMCLAVEGHKLQLHWFRGYLVVVGKDNKPLPRANAGVGGSTLDMNIVTVYDIHHKFLAYSAPIPEVVDILCEWGSLYVLAGDGKIYHLQEKDTQTKLEILFKKNLYDLAIKLAQTQQYDHDGIMDIFRQYGDHLYGKGDHDNAIDQYIKTIGKLEASYVIRKFLDAQRIHNLTKYLQSLHKAQLATEDHTTLLLNCYTKLKDVAKLDEFIMTKDREVDFDVVTAIRVCRSAGYYQHALRLAEKHGHHESYLKVQIEDIHDYDKALEYIGRLEFIETNKQLKKYGKILVKESPQATTELLKRLCTDYKPSQGGDVTKIQRANTSEFIHIFVNNSDRLTEFLQHMVKVQPNSPAVVYNTLLELYLQSYIHQTDASVRTQQERRILDVLYNGEAAYDLDHALVLCHMHNFKAGVLFLYEKAKLYQQILQYHMEHEEYLHIIETCKRFGMMDPQLWVQSLSYFTRKEENCKQHITEVLSHIDKYNLLPPLLVVQTLAHNSTATLSVVKDYIVRRLQQENDQITEDERLIKQYREETDKMKNEIDELQTSAKIFQAAKCSVCSHPLEIPSVHFLCQHSFHQHCFESYSESENECPVCLPENRKILEILRAQEQSRDLHEQFHQQLERAQDGFSVVADYFGRGVFNEVTVITDSPVRSPPPLPPQSSHTLPPKTTPPTKMAPLPGPPTKMAPPTKVSQPSHVPRAATLPPAHVSQTMKAATPPRTSQYPPKTADPKEYKAISESQPKPGPTNTRPVKLADSVARPQTSRPTRTEAKTSSPSLQRQAVQRSPATVKNPTAPVKQPEVSAVPGSNPFQEPDGLNPFESDSTSVSTNPFEDEDDVSQNSSNPFDVPETKAYNPFEE